MKHAAALKNWFINRLTARQRRKETDEYAAQLIREVALELRQEEVRRSMGEKHMLHPWYKGKTYLRIKPRTQRVCPTGF